MSGRWRFTGVHAGVVLLALTAASAEAQEREGTERGMKRFAPAHISWGRGSGLWGADQDAHAVLREAGYDGVQCRSGGFKSGQATCTTYPESGGVEPGMYAEARWRVGESTALGVMWSSTMTYRARGYTGPSSSEYSWWIRPVTLKQTVHLVAPVGVVRAGRTALQAGPAFHRVEMSIRDDHGRGSRSTVRGGLLGGVTLSLPIGPRLALEGRAQYRRLFGTAGSEPYFTQVSVLREDELEQVPHTLPGFDARASHWFLGVGIAVR